MAVAGAAMLLVAFTTPPEMGHAHELMLWIVPHALLAGVLVAAWQLSRRQQRQARLMLTSFEAVQLREWDRARQALLTLLSTQIRHPRARAASLLALAAVAESEHNYEASQKIYEAILTEAQADPLQMHTAQVALAAAMLRNGQTTDAIALIDRLARTDLSGSLKAQIEMLSLFREVTMGQAAEGVCQADERRKLFRAYLGTRAGYGYGLLAVAFDRAGRPDQAQREWHNATLLVRPADLVDRFSDLKAVAARYPAAEYPL